MATGFTPVRLEDCVERNLRANQEGNALRRCAVQHFYTSKAPASLQKKWGAEPIAKLIELPDRMPETL